jgi:RNA polymerase sigma-70 factor (ECF subfamily)
MNRSETTRQASETGGPQHTELLEEAFSRYQDELLGMLYYLVGDLEDARDAFQEAFVKCWRSREKLPEVKNLRAWVFRVALNAGRDLRQTAWRRRRRPLPADDSAGLPSHEAPPEAEVARREQLALVEQAVLALRLEEREVFLLRQNGEMTYDQIAEATNLPVGTVKTRMRLALEKLRKAFAKSGEE